MEFVNGAEFTIARIGRLLRRRELSPVELTRAVLARIERLDPALNAFITVTRDLALVAARRAEREIGRGDYRGPLHGIPVSVKDIFETRGVRTTSGSKLRRRFVPEADAPAVARLVKAGAVLVGKNNLHEWAYGVTSANAHFGPVCNPWDPSRIPGGSSGGSAAAVAAGLGLASLGSDTGGSIRIPAAVCGVVGLKPTRGRVPLSGVTPLASTLDHGGPLCRSVEDAALVLEAVAGADPGDLDSFGARHERFRRELGRGLKGLRIGLPRRYFFERLHPDVDRAVRAAIRVLEAEGAELRDVDLPMLGETGEIADRLTIAEAFAFHQRLLEARPEDYSADIRARMLSAADLRASDYIRAQERRRAYTRRFAEALAPLDALVAPTLPIPAPPIGADEVRVGRARENVRLAMIRFTRPSNLTGFPAISVPCGFSREGLPIGLQLVGRPRDEARLLRVARGYERATRWHERFPEDPDARNRR